jgi:hypothetical protein
VEEDVPPVAVQEEVRMAAREEYLAIVGFNLEEEHRQAEGRRAPAICIPLVRMVMEEA